MQVGDVTELMYSCCVESKFQPADVPYVVIVKVFSFAKFGMRVEVLSFLAHSRSHVVDILLIVTENVDLV